MKTNFGPPRASPQETSIENFTRPELEPFAQLIWDKVGLEPHALPSKGKADTFPEAHQVNPHSSAVARRLQ